MLPGFWAAQASSSPSWATLVLVSAGGAVIGAGAAVAAILYANRAAGDHPSTTLQKLISGTATKRQAPSPGLDDAPTDAVVDQNCGALPAAEQKGASLPQDADDVASPSRDTLGGAASPAVDLAKLQELEQRVRRTGIRIAPKTCLFLTPPPT